VAVRSTATLYCEIYFLEQLPIKQTKKNFESIAKQRFQNFSWFAFERKAL
jgi:hypothetical protein